MNHFNDPKISKILDEKRKVFLNFSLEAYINANTCNNYAEEEAPPADTPATKKEDESQNETTTGRNTDESNSTGLSVEKSNQDQQPQTSTSSGATSAAGTAAAAANQSQKTSKPDNNENESEEEWLHFYMMGKIKEKLNKTSIMESLNFYLKVKITA